MPTPENQSGMQGRSTVEHAEQTLTLLQAMALDFDQSSSQEDLFKRAGRCFRDAGLDVSVWMLTPDGRDIVQGYLSAEHFRPVAARKMRSALDATRKRLPWYSIDADCAFTDTFRDGRIRISDDMLDDLAVMRPDIFGTRKAVEGLYPTWRTMYLPIRVAGKIVGVLAIHDASLSEADEAAMSACAGLLSAHLSSIRRQEAQRRQNELLSTTGHIVACIDASPLSLLELMRTSVRTLAEHPVYDDAFLGIIEGEELQLLAAAQAQPGHRSLTSIGGFSQVARTGQPILAHYVYEGRPGWDPALSHAPASVLALPLLGGIEGDKTLGVLGVVSAQPDRLGADDQQMIEIVAANVVAALHRIRLYEHSAQELSRRSRELRSVIAVGQAVTRNLDSCTLLKDLLSVGVTAANARQGYLLQIVDEGRNVRIASVAGLPPDAYVGRVGPLERSLLQWVVEHGEPLCVPDTSVEGWYSDSYSMYWTDRPRSILVTPIRQAGKIVGGLALTDKRAGTFDEADIRFAHSISLWAAQGLENAALFQQTRERRMRLDRAITQIGRALAGGPDVQDTAATALQVAANLVDVDSGTISLPKGPQDQVEVVAAFGNEHPPSSANVSDDGTAESGSQEWRADCCPTILQHPQCGDESGTCSRAFISLPVDIGGSCAGALTLQRDRDEVFSAEDISLLLSLSQHAGAAIRRVRLAEEVDASARYLDSLLQSTGEAILLLKSDGATEYANNAARILARTFVEGELDGIAPFFPLSDDEARARQIWHRLRSGESPIRVELVAKDRLATPRHFTVRLSLLARGSGYLLVARETTPQARLNRLRHDFLRHLHHQLGTPLSSVLGFLQLLAGPRQLARHPQQICVEGAHLEALKVRRLVHDLQSYTLLGVPLADPLQEPADIREIFTLVELELAQRSDVTASSTIFGAGPSPRYSETQLVHLLLRLVDCLAQLARHASTPLRIDMHAHHRGDSLEVQLTAPSLRLPPDQLQRLLSPTRILLDEWTGPEDSVGLGLALIRRVVETARGSFWTSSSADAGTTLALILPAGGSRSVP